VVYNASLLGAGPVTQLAVLNRLLARGARPRWLVLEVWAPLLYQDGLWSDEDALARRGVRLTDLPLVRHYFAHPWPAYGECCQAHLLPCARDRVLLLNRFAPRWLPGANRPNEDGYRTLDGWGWLQGMWDTSPDAYRPRAEDAYRVFFAAMFEHYHIRPVAGRALRKLLKVCRRERIAVAFLVMPESSDFRRRYPPAVRSASDAYLAGLARAHEVPLVDARTWMPDGNFSDGFHLLGKAAGPFTERLGRRVLQPLVDGRLCGPLAPRTYFTRRTIPPAWAAARKQRARCLK
jgi:hypothetical protein